MEEKNSLLIILPEEMAELPVRIIKGKMRNELVLHFIQLKEPAGQSATTEKKYALVWQKNDYVKIEIDDIMWIQADHGYSDLMLKNGEKMTVSFNLTFVGKDLPMSCFMRIHKSYIVNLKHVKSLKGSDLIIGNAKLPLGREYREKLLERFHFVGIRGKTK